jgi:transposase
MAQRFAGFDLHKKEIEVCIIDDSGKILRRDRITADRNSITHFATGHNLADCIVALEATTNTWPVANLLKPLCADVIVSNPLRTKAIAQARIKTDKVDALVLAQLLRTDFLPRVWIPDDHTRRMRDLTTQRSMLVSDRTRIKNRIHATLHQRLIPAPGGDLFSLHNLQWLRCSITIDEDGRQALDRQLRLLDQIEAELLLLTDKLAQLAYLDNQVQLLMTLPGIDFAIAQAILAAFGDITRFSSANKAAAYLGLVPSTRQSGDKCYHGPITKQGRSHARWLLVQAAQHLDCHPGPLGHFFRKICKKKNRNVAVVACARKLVTIAWHMLKNNEPYRYAQSRTVDEKLSRLRVRATGKRHKTGPKKGQPPSPNRGTGRKTRNLPGLNSIYTQAGLPPIQPLKPGELKMLHQSGSADFAAAVLADRRVEKRVGGKRGHPKTQ